MEEAVEPSAGLLSTSQHLNHVQSPEATLQHPKEM